MNSDTSAPLVCQLPAECRIKVIGLGGIGCVLLPYLAVFLRSLKQVTRLVLIDGDTFDPVTNPTRMIFEKVGNKAEVKAAETIALLGSCDVSVADVPEYLTAENRERLIREGDWVFLCVDNHPTRKFVSERCDQLADVVLISGGNEGVEPPRERGTYGNVQVAVRRENKDLTAPLTRYHPEIANPRGKMPTEVDCGQLAVSSPQVLFTNIAVASAMLNAFYACLCERLTYQEVKFDILDARMLPQFPIGPEQASGRLPR